MRYEIRMGGTGGQGIILAGVILAEAVSMYEDKNVVQTASYGPESRGGYSKVDIVVSDDEIDYPKALNVDLFVAMAQDAVDKFSKGIRASGTVVIDEDMVYSPPLGQFEVVKAPITRSAVEKVGKAVTANMVALGVISKVSGIVSFSSLEKAVLSRVPKGTEEINKKALEVGYNLL